MGIWITVVLVLALLIFIARYLPAAVVVLLGWMLLFVGSDVLPSPWNEISEFLFYALGVVFTIGAIISPNTYGTYR